MNDFIVVGGGAIGMLTARELSKAGASVVLIERAGTGRESSWAGGGILSPLYPWRYDDAITRLAQWSQNGYEALAEDLRAQTGIDPEWTPSGFLVLGVEDSAEALAWAARFGSRLENPSPAEISRIEPSLTPPPGAPVWMSGIAQIRNPRLVRALRIDIAQRGVDVLEHHAAQEICNKRDRASGVVTDHGLVEGNTVIVTAGAWTAELLEPYAHRPEIGPVRGQMILINARPNLLNRIVLHDDHYLIPRRDGRVLCGSTLEHAGFVKETTPTALQELRALALALAPALEDFPVEHHWAGLRPGSPRGIPFIGPHPTIDGLYVNAGHFRNGLVLGPASARLLADLALARDPIVPPPPYALGTQR
jgi:glycine oxidase